MTGRATAPARCALLCLGAALATVGTTALLLALQGRLHPQLWPALLTGGAAGSLLFLPALVRARRTATSREGADLGRLLDGLHLRLRLSEQDATRQRRAAQTSSAGVFELLSGLVAAEEGARGQLAAELHDTVAQSLMIARGLLAGGASTPADLARLTDYVDDAEEQVRAVMARTRPPALRDGDLARAVSGLQAEMRQRYGLEVRLRWPQQPHPLPSASAVIVYRFFQEALLNVVKHADVDDAEATLVVDEDVVRASVADQGPGFEPDAVRPDRGRHVGLGLLRERARLAGGTVEVVSHPGRGTTLTLRLPRPSFVPSSARTAPAEEPPAAGRTGRPVSGGATP